MITKISRMGGLPNFLGYGAIKVLVTTVQVMSLCKRLFEDSTDTEKKRRELPQVPGRKEVIIGNFIIWLNPRAGNMKRFLCTDCPIFIHSFNRINLVWSRFWTLASRVHKKAKKKNQLGQYTASRLTLGQ